MKRDPNPNFEEMGIPPGSELRLIQDPSKTVKVIDHTHVRHQSGEYSLGAITKKLLNNTNISYHTRYWTHNGQCLREIYERTQNVRRHMECVPGPGLTKR